MEVKNRNGPPLLPCPLHLQALTVSKVKDLQEKGAQVVDIRSPSSFAGGHVPGSLHIWREGLSAFAGYFLNDEDPIIIADDFNQGLGEIQRQFARIGYDNIAGCLEGGFMAWAKAAEPVGTVKTWTVHEAEGAPRRPVPLPPGSPRRAQLPEARPPPGRPPDLCRRVPLLHLQGPYGEGDRLLLRFGIQVLHRGKPPPPGRREGRHRRPRVHGGVGEGGVPGGEVMSPDHPLLRPSG